MKPAAPIWLSLAALAAACGNDDTRSPVNSPGRPESAGTAVLEAGATALQDMPPVRALNAYLDGFHFYNGRLAQQMEAHHFCSIVNDELIQCVIYDGNVADARLMGVEYIISARLFAALPPEEKMLWHSHVHEVKSGQLIAPGIPDVAEHALMRKLVGTYGKTWHTWHTDLQQRLPLGVPQLMMGFVADGQIDLDMVSARDRRFGVDSERKRLDRQDIASPPIEPGADAWREGRVFQVEDPTGSHPRAEAASRGATEPPPGTNARSAPP